MKETANVAYTLSAKITEFAMPPVVDGLVIGVESPIGHTAISRALQLLVESQFQTIAFEKDDRISHAIVRKTLLRRIPEAKIAEFILTRIKPLMAADDIMHLHLTVEINITESQV